MLSKCLGFRIRFRPRRTTVSPRRSSKKVLSDDHGALSLRSSSLASSMEHKKKKLKHSGSLDSVYWADACGIVAEEIKKTTTDEALKYNEFLQHDGQVEHWPDEKIKFDLDARKRALSSKFQLLREHVSRANFEGKGQEAAVHRSYVTLFTTSIAGLNIRSSQRHGRDNSEQSNFRKPLLDTYNLRRSGAKINQVSVVVLGQWMPVTIVTASHLVASRFGKTTLTAREKGRNTTIPVHALLRK